MVVGGACFHDELTHLFTQAWSREAWRHLTLCCSYETGQTLQPLVAPANKRWDVVEFHIHQFYHGISTVLGVSVSLWGCAKGIHGKLPAV